MECVEGGEIFFQQFHGIVVKTILPSSFGLSGLPDLSCFGRGLVAQDSIQIVCPKGRDVVPVFLPYLVKRESCTDEIGFQQHLDSVRCKMKDRGEQDSG